MFLVLSVCVVLLSFNNIGQNNSIPSPLDLIELQFMDFKEKAIVESEIVFLKGNEQLFVLSSGPLFRLTGTLDG